MQENREKLYTVSRCKGRAKKCQSDVRRKNDDREGSFSNKNSGEALRKIGNA